MKHHPNPPAAAMSSGGLTAGLPAFTVEQAAACRLAFDARFQRWLAKWLEESSLSVRPGGNAAMLGLQLQSDHGALTVALEPADWPALHAAAELADAATASAVLTLLLQPWSAPLAGALSEWHVVRAERHAGVADMAAAAPLAAATLATPTATVTLLGCAPALVLRLQCLWPPPEADDIAGWAGLQMCGRIRVLERCWPMHLLGTLAAGDLVLPAAGPAAPLLWRVGIGRALQARVTLDFNEQALHLMETPQLADEPLASDTEAPPAAWAALQLPVTFELDTARISLAELASMRPGCAIELDQPMAEATVRLVCHGQTLGHGQLVAIGERLGVRITHMGLANEAAGL
jgi:type III secretion protein Q